MLAPAGQLETESNGESLLALLLREQQTLTTTRELTAVEEFSRHHESCPPSTNGRPAQAKYYESLLPASPPGPGQQYAFEVDLDSCSGCKACVTACHSLNGLDDNETWRDVGLMIGGTNALPVLQHVTTACHHCLEPACMSACPVNAYEKDATTGIVKHLDDQCFGCQYCTLACPYDVPKYHAAKGIVRKCDMCSDRLSAGEAPACVQACPHQAIAIRVVDVATVIEDSEAAVFLPGAPDPQITLPTTTYKTARPFPRNMLPVDYHSVRTQNAHWPLVLMLVLTQLSVGAFVIGLLLDRFLESSVTDVLRPLHTASALLFGFVALGSSLFHLGRPQFAYRAVLGLKHSWLSREIVAFGAFAGSASMLAALSLFPFTSSAQHFVAPEQATAALAWLVALTGIGGVFCSVMIYVFTQREVWSFPITATKFVLTSVILGSAAAWLSMMLLCQFTAMTPASQTVRSIGPLLCQVLLTAAATKLLFEALLLRHLASKSMTVLKRRALLLTGELASQTLARFACGILGGVAMPAFLLFKRDELAASSSGDVVLLILVSLLFIACLVGELLERYLFFAAASSPKMPGNLK